MDFRGLSFVMVVVLNVVCAALISAAQEDPNSYNEITSGSALTIKHLEERLREDIVQELEDLRQYEMELRGKFFKMQNKKRQLEIRKRQPVQCLVNIVSCWRRK